MARLRRWVREERLVRLTYRDLKEARSERTVRPMVLAFFPPVWLLLGWCELRRAFRSFRLDRIEDLNFLPDRYPQKPERRLVDDLRRVGYRAGA